MASRCDIWYSSGEGSGEGSKASDRIYSSRKLYYDYFVSQSEKKDVIDWVRMAYDNER